MKRFMIRKALMYFLCICIMMSVGYTGNVTSAAAESPATQPALVNPGFELPVVGESIPGWSKTLGTTGSVSVTSALFRSGASSLKIFDNDAVSFNVESDRIEVTAGNEYLASAWWFLEQTPNPSAQMQIKFYDSSNNLVPNSTVMNSQTFTAGGHSMWQRFAVKAVAPPAAASAVIVMITGTAAKGNAYIDDVSFERVISTVTNPLRNAGLEEDVAGGIPGWAPMFGGAGTNGSVTVDKTKYHSGTSSLKLDDQDTTVLFGAISDKIAVTPNTNYSASAAVFATGGSIQIQLRFYTSTGAATTAPTSVYEQTVHSAGWQPISVSSVAPSNSAFAAIVIASPSARSGKGTSYWDDFKIEQLKQPIAAVEPPLGTFAALQNPNFELPLSDGFVQHWKSLNGTQGIAQDVNTKHEGAQSLKLDNPSSQLLGVMSNYVTVNAGRNQTVSAMVYRTGVAAAEIQLNFYDQANQLLDQANQTLTPAIGSWTKLSVTKAAPANTVTIAVVLKNSGQGTLYYDQVEWTEEIPPAPPAPKYFVPNGGFEAPTTGSSIPNWKVNAGLASVSSLEKKEGQQSLFVSNVKTTGAGINMESELIDVQEGATYRLGTQFYLETGALEGLYVYVYDQAG
ncbi:MAG: hypothetical protein K0Q81_745, partial [Paenibacillus sp.]|nr:hypothetical protein [Paenibacillus sp.]